MIEELEVEVTIQYLNYDCLIYIFEHLTIKENLKLEKVCKSWERVLRLCWRQSKSLIIDYNNEDILLNGKSINSSKSMITNFFLSVSETVLHSVRITF